MVQPNETDGQTEIWIDQQSNEETIASALLKYFQPQHHFLTRRLNIDAENLYYRPLPLPRHSALWFVYSLRMQ